MRERVYAEVEAFLLMLRFFAVFCCVGTMISACEPADSELSFSQSACETGACLRSDFDDLAEKTHLCRYEVDLAGMRYATPFPVITLEPFSDDRFCGWHDQRLQYTDQIEGTCPKTQDFKKHLNVKSTGPVIARLVGVSKALSMKAEDLQALSQIRCHGVPVRLDNATNRSHATAAGELDQTQAFRIDGDVGQQFDLEWAISELRGLNGLPIAAAFYSADQITVFWRSSDYPFVLNACEETRQRLIENGALTEASVCSQEQ